MVSVVAAAVFVVVILNGKFCYAHNPRAGLVHSPQSEGTNRYFFIHLICKGYFRGSWYVYFLKLLLPFLHFVPVETLSNGQLLLSPPHNNAQMQRNENHTMQITQPCSAPSSPIASPGAHSSTSFSLPCNLFTNDTGDPNWQANKSTVRERNAAMFNNELMSDICFIVGSDGGKWAGIFFTIECLANKFGAH